MVPMAVSEPDLGAAWAAVLGNSADPELPKRLAEGRPTGPAADRALVRKPQIGDTRPAPPGPATTAGGRQAGTAT